MCNIKVIAQTVGLNVFYSRRKQLGRRAWPYINPSC